MVGGMGAAKGRAAIQKMMETSIGTGSRGSNYHLFTNETIDVRGAWKFQRRTMRSSKLADNRSMGTRGQ
jgi:hypothetical protein